VIMDFMTDDIISRRFGIVPRQVLLSSAVDAALSYLTLPDEKAVRQAFGLQPDPRLEDVPVGDWQVALKCFPAEAIELLRSFV
jgi:hypothetical protein